MALIVMPSLLSKRPWARIRARCDASCFIVLSKSARCCSVRGHTYLMIIHLGIGFTSLIVLQLSRKVLYQKTFGRALSRSQKGKVRWEVFLAIKRKYPLQRPKLSLPYTRLKQYAVL